MASESISLDRRYCYEQKSRNHRRNSNVIYRANCRMERPAPLARPGCSLAVLVAAFFLSSSLGVRTSDVTGSGDARTGWELFEDRFDMVEPAAELILFSNPALDVDTTDFRSIVDTLLGDLRALEGVASIISYYDTLEESMISENRHVLIARLTFEPAETEELEKQVEPVMEAVSNANESVAGFDISMLGGVSSNVMVNNMVAEEFGVILIVALVGGFIIMMLTFGAVVAALIPLALALASIFAAVGAAVLVSRIEPLNFFFYEMTILMGLAVGIDYSLFIINRFREERANGYPKMDASSGPHHQDSGEAKIRESQVDPIIRTAVRLK